MNKYCKFCGKEIIESSECICSDFQDALSYKRAILVDKAERCKPRGKEFYYYRQEKQK